MSASRLPSDELLREAAFQSRLLPDDGPSASQPLPDVFRNRARQTLRRFTNERRPKSLLHREFGIELDASEIETLRRDVLDVVTSRLQQAGVSIKNLPERFFSWMLPKNDANAEDWNLLINNPILLSNVRLRKMLKMDLSTTTREAEPGETLFYVRTFAFTLEEFIDLIQALFDDGFGSSDVPYVLWELVQHLDPAEDADQTIFVRYCGTTTKGSAWERHQDDLRNKYAGLKSTFFDITQRLFPHVMACVEIDEFPDATLYGNLDAHKQHVVDLREQGLIALFGQSTLLNSAKGGLSTRFVPHATDREAIEMLGASLLGKLPLYTGKYQHLDLIHRYSQDVQDYAQSHPATTNTARYPIGDPVKDLIYRSAVPALVEKYPIMLTVGSDLTPDEGVSAQLI